MAEPDETTHRPWAWIAMRSVRRGRDGTPGILCDVVDVKLVVFTKFKASEPCTLAINGIRYAKAVSTINHLESRHTCETKENIAPVNFGWARTVPPRPGSGAEASCFQVFVTVSNECSSPMRPDAGHPA